MIDVEAVRVDMPDNPFNQVGPAILVMNGDKTLGDASLEAEHTAMFALEYGLARMWTTWGVRPDVVLGQR